MQLNALCLVVRSYSTTLKASKVLGTAILLYSFLQSRVQREFCSAAHR